MMLLASMLRGIKQEKLIIHPWISKRFRFFYTPQPWTLALIDRINDMPSLHTLKDWWDKSNVTWFLRGQTSEKNCQWKKSRLSLFILDNRKWRPFHLKNDNVEIWVEVIIVTFFYAVATVDVLMSNSNDVNLAKTRYVRFEWLWNCRLVLIE